MKNFFKKLGLIILGLIFAFFFTEMAVRISGIYKKPFGAPNGYYVADSNLDYDISKNFPLTSAGYVGAAEMKIWSNNIGCFDKPYNNEKSAILLVGDSFAWGFAPFEQKWGTILEQNIGERVLKCGVVGYGTKQEFFKAKKIIEETKIKPKLIIVGYFYNDMMDDFLVPRDTVINGNLLSKKSVIGVGKDKVEIKKFSDEELSRQLSSFQKCNIKCFIGKNFQSIPIIYKLIRNGMIRIFGYNSVVKLAGLELSRDVLLMENMVFIPDNAGYQWIKEARDNHFRNILEFKKFADAQNAKLVFVLIPTREMVYNFLGSQLKQNIPQIDFQYGNKSLKDFMDKNKIVYLDLWPDFGKYADQNKSVLDNDKDLYWTDDLHWNIGGNQLAGSLVSNFFSENNYLLK